MTLLWNRAIAWFISVRGCDRTTHIHRWSNGLRGRIATGWWLVWGDFVQHALYESSVLEDLLGEQKVNKREHDTEIGNRSNNRPFEDILRARMSRRNVLAKGAALSATGFFAALAGNKLFAEPAAASTSQTVVGAGRTMMVKSNGGGLINFKALAIADGSGATPAISPDYKYDVLIPWGTPIKDGGPEYTGGAVRPTSAEQAEQIGIGHDGMHFFPKDGTSTTQGILCINHEFGRDSHVLGKDDPESLEDVRLSQHAHGVAVVEIKKMSGKWQVVDNGKNRRIHVNTPVEIAGEAAGSALLETPAGNEPKGTVNNCANGYTPWGTYLTCEENFNGYFGATDSDWVPTDEQARYGFSSTGFGYGWYEFDPRFDLSNPQYKNEENRFGWVVEIDPNDPTRKPIKRTELGRFKHENAELVVGEGNRVVVYMGDDQRFDYIYKFVSANDYNKMFQYGTHPLDRGTLYVAKFNENGRGIWIGLSRRNPRLRGLFKSHDEILTYARLAADAVGATPMDRPEWITTAPNGDIYVALTNNSRRAEPNAPNPLAPNADGHILRIKENNGNTGRNFLWDIAIKSVETHGEGDDRTFSDPDGLWADPDGRLFIQTDGGQKKELNNQMLVADTHDFGNIRRMFTGPAGCEITGIAYTPDRQTLFINVQHPGDGDPTETNFPAPTDGVTIPRDATVVITKKGGGIVGS
ncbi:MAG: PhoX family phosphatase [Leptolyngbyaceae cyanobacterium]